MADSIGRGFPTSGINAGHIFFNAESESLWAYIGGNPRVSSSWKLLLGSFETDPDTSTWGVNQAGAMWYNSSQGMFKGWIGTSVVIVSQVNPHNTVYQNEDFLGGTVASGQLGKLGWQIFGPASRPTAVINNPGQVRSTTAAGSPGATAGIFIPEVNNVLAQRAFDIAFIYRAVQVDSDTELRAGMSQGAAITPTEGVFFRKLGAQTTWQAVCVTGGTETSVNTGVQVDTDYHFFRIRNVNGVMMFNIDSSPNFSIATNIPAVAMVVIAMVGTLSAAAKSCDVDYFEVTITNLIR
jgi:hypothetical protein